MCNIRNTKLRRNQLSVILCCTKIGTLKTSLFQKSDKCCCSKSWNLHKITKVGNTENNFNYLIQDSIERIPSWPFQVTAAAMNPKGHILHHLLQGISPKEDIIYNMFHVWDILCHLSYYVSFADMRNLPELKVKAKCYQRLEPG